MIGDRRAAEGVAVNADLRWKFSGESGIAFGEAWSQTGQPFGPGPGLEDALGLVRRHIPLDDLRPVGDMMAVSLIAPTTEPGNPAPGMYEIEDLERVMAIDWNVHDEAMGLAGAAKTFLGQRREDGENMWELWKGRDDVAAEFLCWHAVAYLRLIEIGKLPPHESDP